MARRILTAALCAVVLVAASPAYAAGWRRRIDDTIGTRRVGVSVRLDGHRIYSHEGRNRRIPASNQKLLMSMALLDRLHHKYRIRTLAAVVRGTLEDGVVAGDLWLLGRGDPTVTDGGRYARSLYMNPTRMKKLARHVKNRGIKRITGRVMGSTGYFSHDWYATGWKPDFPAEEVPMPTALTFDGNRVGDTHIADPERRAAQALTRRLKKMGVRVTGGRGAQGDPPARLKRIAKMRSQKLKTLLRVTNRQSSNFFAEVLGKRLAVETFGPPGSIAKAAEAMTRFARKRGVRVRSYDASGLSYDNRVSPRGMSRLLASVESERWFRPLRETLPKGGQGTLADRLGGIRVRAKTGSLEKVSTLSGWVWLKRVDRWCAFSIMSRGMEKPNAADIEDRIVRILTNSAR